MNICILVSTLSSFTLCILKEIPWTCSPTAFVNLSRSFKVLTMNFPFHPALAQFVGHSNSRNLTVWVIWDSCVLKKQKEKKYGRWGLYHVCDVLCSSQPQEGWTEGCAGKPRHPLVCVHSFLPMTNLTARAISPNTPVQYMRGAGQTARLLSSHLSFLHTKIQTEILEEWGRMPNSLWATDTAKPLWRHLIPKCARHLGTYPWHSFHPSADTTPCARCLAKGWFATGSRSTSLLQHQHQLLCTLQQTQSKFLLGRQQCCGQATWAGPCLHLLPGAALPVLCRLDEESSGPRLAPACLKAPATDAGELTGAPLWPLCQVAVACTSKQEITAFQKELALKDKDKANLSMHQLS